MADQQVFIEMGNSTNKQNGQADLASHSNVDTLDGNRNRALRSVPETDDDDDDDRPLAIDAQRGVDDGFLPPNGSGNSRPPTGDGPRSRRPNFGFSINNPTPEYVEIDGVRMQVPDVNAYQHKKTLAQGMMDLALLSANANQLRYVLETYQRHPYFYPSLIFITLSIIFQVAVGVGLILNGRYNVNDQKEICRANKINNYTVIGIFVVTVVNVFVSAFGVADPLAS